MPRAVELRIPAGDTVLPATLTLPDEPARGGVVALHGATGPERDHFLFTHLARSLAPIGVAVLACDRRAPASDDDVPFEVQASDAIATLRVLREHVGDVRLGLWAFSQGAWAAPLAASRSRDVSFLVLVGAAGVSPAEQMRYSAAESVRRAGFDEGVVERAVGVRVAVEAFLRGAVSRESAQRAVDEVAEEPWFELVWLPAVLPPSATWADAGFEPQPILERVSCPILLVYGDDEAVPAERSIQVFDEAARVSGARLEVARLARSTHLPTIGGAAGLEAIDPEYEQALLDWLGRELERTG